MPFSNMKKVEAQNVSTGSTTTVGYGATNSGGSSSLSGYVDDLSPLISKLPGCTSTIGSGVGDLFKGIKNLFSKNSKTSKYTDTSDTSTLTSDVNKLTSELTTIPTFDKTNDTNITDVRTKLNQVLSENKDIKKATVSDNQNSTCLDGIGKAIVKMLIDKMTVSIVSWIQTGNAGDSFFVKDPSEFFKDIAKNEILAFGQEISDPAKYPFGKNFMIGAANNFNNKFQDNAQYSLDKIMQQNSLTLGISTGNIPTPQDFFGDFSQGGWGAWDAMVQNPANNPLGFQLIASNELEFRLAGTVKSPAEIVDNALMQANGFLGDERCTDPKGVTREENALALSGDTSARKCNKWEYVTPGKTISDELTHAMGVKDNALLDASTLNDAIAAILDAALARLSSELTNEGLSAISQDDISLSYSDQGYSDQGLSTIQQNQTDRDFSNYQRDGSPWLQGHPDFDIRKDINQALIDEQRIYIEKLQKQNTILPELIKTIYQLDYCIPGPHPGWEDDAQNKLNQITNSLNDSVNKVQSMTDGTVFGILDFLSLGALSSVVTTVNTYTFTCGSDNGQKIFQLIGSTINDITGLDKFNAIITDSSDNTNLCSVSGFQTISQEIMKQYSILINKYFNKTNLPSVAKEAENKFNEIPGYQQMLSDNEGAIAFQQGVIKRLQTIKTGIESLNPASATYETDLIAWKNSFARLSPSLVSGGDIEHVDSLSKQAEDERVYVLKDLLQGPAGCEVELKTKQSFWKNDQSLDWFWRYARPAYPFPTLYGEYSVVNNYHYANYKIDGISPADPVRAPASSGSQLTGWNSAFLGDVIFAMDGEADMFISSVPWSNPNAWYNAAINFNRNYTTRILNLNSAYRGGNAVYFEKALGIY
jgi:hypothetical protein